LRILGLAFFPAFQLTRAWQFHPQPLSLDLQSELEVLREKGGSAANGSGGSDISGVDGSRNGISAGAAKPGMVQPGMTKGEAMKLVLGLMERVKSLEGVLG
jgi:hypothetical protein